MTSHNLRAKAIALGLLTCAAASAQTMPRFFRKDVITPTSRDFLFGRNVLTGDFDGNGLTDVAVTTPGEISILRNSGGGNSGAGVFAMVHTSHDALGFYSAADLNGDGRTDLIEAGVWSADGRILLSQGDGTFTPRVDIPGL